MASSVPGRTLKRYEHIVTWLKLRLYFKREKKMDINYVTGNAY